MENSSPVRLDAAIKVIAALASDALVAPEMALLTDAAVLELITATDRVASLAEAARAEAIREAERREAAQEEAHCATAEWIRRGHGHSLQRCRSIVRDAVRQGRFSALVAAQATGEVRSGQASAIARVLDELPDDFSAEQLAEAEATMITLAADHCPDDLLRLGWYLIEVVAPERVDELMAEKLEREEREAQKKKGLSLADDGHGIMHIKGRLPSADGEALAAVLNARAESAWKRHEDEVAEAGGDPGPKDKKVLLADALMALVRAHQVHRDAPTHGGDRPRVNVFLKFEDLVGGLGEMAMSSGRGITAHEARRLACDCDIIPMVLNSLGIPLDVGRAERLVNAHLRSALVARDGGCVFPGCDRGGSECEAHHIQPWWAGGVTSLDNLVLLCPSHHRRCEPGRNNTWDDDDPDRWHVRLGPDRLPQVTPPRGYDPERKTMRHARFGLFRR